MPTPRHERPHRPIAVGPNGQTSGDSNGAAPPVERDDDLLTPAMVAALLSVRIRTVYSWLGAGYIPSVRLPEGTRAVRRVDARIPEAASGSQLSTGEAAQRLGISADRLRQLARAGRVAHHVTLGGLMRYDQSDIDALLRDGQETERHRG